MGSKVKYRVPSLAYWPALLWPGAQPPTERDRIQPWERFHQAVAAGEDGTLPQVVAEFGIGRGDWLRKRAKAEPQAVFLGVEASMHFTRYADRHTREAGLTNLFLAFGDARLAVLPAFIPAGTLSEAHFLFPDPWTRNRHKWRRMLAPRNIPFIVRAMRPGGLLRVRSDVPDYIVEARENLNEIRMRCLADETNRDPAQAVTRWERRKLAEGATIGELRYLKPEDLDARLRASGRWPGFEDVPLDLRGVAKHEPSILRNGGYEPLPEVVADEERPAAAQRTGYGPLSLRDRALQAQVTPHEQAAGDNESPLAEKGATDTPSSDDLRARTRRFHPTLAPHDASSSDKNEQHRP